MPVDLRSVRRAIEERNLPWTAGTTSVSELPEQEQRAHLGLRPREGALEAGRHAIEAANTLQALAAPRFGAPPAVDWRSNGGNWVTPIRDQQSCGACVSFATLATVESRIRQSCRNATLDIDLAEAYLFYCGCGNCCDTGWDFAPALDFCKNTGFSREADFPYTPADQPCRSSAPILGKITAWVQVLAIAERKAYLADRGPMVGGLAVYNDFFAYRSGVYRRTSNELAGYHAVSIIGYDDTQQCWICKNSWGPGWGDSGFFRMGYGEAEMDTSFAFYGLTVDCPQPAPPPVDDCQQFAQILVRVLATARTNRELRLCLCRYICRGRRNTNCSPAVLRLVNTVAQILQRCPQFRAAFCDRLGC
jgi:C1A family cysteine protease